MTTARREVVLAALASALAAISSVPGLAVERNRRAAVDGEADLASGPLIVLRDGDQARLDLTAAVAHYVARPRCEIFARADTAAASETALEAVYAALVSAVEGDAGLAAAAFRVRAGDMVPGIDPDAGHRAVAAFSVEIEAEFHAAPADPFAAA